MSTTTPRIFPDTGLDLVDVWLPSLDGVTDTLRSGAIVADLVSGDGAGTVAMARAFPRSAFTGYDTDADAVSTAREAARHAVSGGAGGRNVRFDAVDAAEIPLYAFDLVTTLGGLAAMADPVAVARRVALALAHGGTWMIVEPEDGLPVLAAALEAAGFRHLQITAQTADGVVVEAQP